MAQPDDPADEIPCKDCRAYYRQHMAFLSYPQTYEWATPELLPPFPRKPRKPHLINGKSTPGDRCTTHWRAERNRKRAAGHARRVQNVYSIPIETYNALKEFQGGVCAICRRATGATKRLAVDHDHTCCSGKTSCGNCVRGLLCSQCNSMLAHARDQASFFSRAWHYLKYTPYQKMQDATDETLEYDETWWSR